MKNRNVFILISILVVSIAVILTVKSENKESVTIYRHVSPIGEKVIKNNNDLKKLKAIIDELNVEFVRENDEVIFGHIYLVRFVSGDIVREYRFLGDKVYYVERKNGETLLDKWYKSNEDNLAKIEEIFMGP